MAVGSHGDKRKLGAFGFTLLEIMVVVAIISLLASVATPMYGKYLRRTKTSEALTNIRKIYDGELAYYHEDHVLASGNLASKQFLYCSAEPSEHPTDQKRRGNFERGNWPLIHFSTDGPIYYTYLVEVSPDPDPVPDRPSWIPGFGEDPESIWMAAMLIRAFGDLDHDGNVSQFARWAFVNENAQLRGMAGVAALDELE